MYVCMYVCMYMQLYIYTYIYICIRTYIYIHTHSICIIIHMYVTFSSRLHARWRCGTARNDWSKLVRADFFKPFPLRVLAVLVGEVVESWLPRFVVRAKAGEAEKDRNAKHV